VEFAGWLGRKAVHALQYTGGVLSLFYAAVRSLIVERLKGWRLVFQITIMQTYFTGVQALPVISVSALVLGLVVIYQADSILHSYGLSRYLEEVIIVIICREMAPLIIALILIGRSGTAIATELGNMKLNREVEALSIMGINTDYFIVFPRLLGVTLATLSITVVFNVVAIFGGFTLAKVLGLLRPGLLLNVLVAAANLKIIRYAVLKAVLFGWVISLVNCYHGLNVQVSFTEVPQAATKGVVQSIFLCFILNGVLSVYVVS
jgi:phospholipid/cholesterol/gamma-HCH transport system permease protein